MPNAYFYSNIASAAQLNGGIDSAVTTCVVDTTAGWPVTFPFVIALDFGGASEELVRVDNNSSNTLTIVRAFGGTNAVSHSAGAVVRHVHNAVDDTDFRTHEAATQAVHGVISSLVGTDDTQTLTNKTLDHPGITTPAIGSGGSLAGTFTGTPTFSGAVTLSGTPSISNGAALAGTFSGTPAFSGLVGFTAGQAVSGAPVTITRAATTDLGLRVFTGAETFNRWQVAGDGRLNWGDGAGAADTNLYRSNPNELKTDDSLVVGSSISAGNFNTGAWTAYNPTWTTSTGAALPVYGNAVKSGAYVKIGRLVIFSFTVIFGSTTNFGAGATINDNWQFSLPGGLTASAYFQGGNVACGSGVAFQTNPNTAPFIVRCSTDGLGFSLDVSGGLQGGGVPAQFGTIDALTPWTWAQTNRISFSGAVEVTT